MILDCLKETAEVGSDFAPTERNAATFFKLGLGWSLQGEPSLVAVDDEGAILGYTLWGPLASPELDYLSQSCAGLGTYVLPVARRFGVSHDLRNAAFQVAKAQGYSRILGTTYDRRGLNSVLKLGFVPCGELVEKKL